MRHLETGLVDLLLAVQEEIQIERPRAARRPLPDASECGLDLEQQSEEIARA